MKFAFSLFIIGLALFPASVNADSPPPICGGFPLQYETTIGLTRPVGSHKNRASSVIALAGITRGDSLVPLAWIVWDERGEAWLAVTRSTPKELTALWTMSKSELDFSKYPELVVRFAPLLKPLPKAFSLVDCRAAEIAVNKKRR